MVIMIIVIISVTVIMKIILGEKLLPLTTPVEVAQLALTIELTRTAVGHKDTATTTTTNNNNNNDNNNSSNNNDINNIP